MSQDRQITLARAAQVRPRNDDELHNYLKFFWGISFPRICNPKCEGRCTSLFKVLADAYFARYPMIILKGARGCGKSVLLGTLALTEQVSLGAEVMILGGSSVQAKKVFEYISQKNTRFEGMFWQSPNAPKALQDVKTELQESSKIINGGIIKCMPASQTSIYGQRPSRLRIDEADVCDLELIDGAIPCAHPVHHKGIQEQILISSTHYNVSGTLTTLIERATATNDAHRAKCIAEGLPDPGPNCVIPVYEVCYKDALSEIGGYLTAEQLDRMKSMVSPEVWRRQFENGEPSVEGSVFSSDDLDSLFDPSLGVHKGEPGTHWEIDFNKIQNKEFECYFHGADWGLKIDWTIISTFACPSSESEPDIMTGWYRPHKELGIMGHVRLYDSILQRFPGPAAHDRNRNESICN